MSSSLGVGKNRADAHKARPKSIVMVSTPLRTSCYSIHHLGRLRRKEGFILERYKLPAWKSRAVRHSSVRTKRQAEKRPQKDVTVGYFLNSEESVSSRRNNAPKIKGRRLHLEVASDE